MKTKILAVALGILILITIVGFVGYELGRHTPGATYKKSGFGSEIPAAWSQVYFGSTQGPVRVGGTFQGQDPLVAQREFSFSPGIIHAGEATSPQADFYFIDSATSTQNFVAVARAKGAVVTQEKIGDSMATVIRDPSYDYDPGSTQYFITYRDKNRDEITLLILTRRAGGKEFEAGFSHFLKNAAFNGSDPATIDF